MSRGGYTAAIDMWSLGCIFGELLQRIAHVGSAATPNLQARCAGGRGGGGTAKTHCALALRCQAKPAGKVCPVCCRLGVCSRQGAPERWLHSARTSNRGTTAPSCPPQAPLPPTPPCCQVAPLFAIHGLPKTPADGETFVGSPGNEMVSHGPEAGRQPACFSAAHLARAMRCHS